MKAIIKGSKPTIKVSAVKLGNHKVTPGKKGHVVSMKKAKHTEAARESLVDKILRLTVETRIDGPTVWLGNGTKRPLWDALVSKATELGKAKLKKTSEILLVTGKVGYAWCLTGLNGDTYERMHGKVAVRGSITLLKKEYGANNVKLVTLDKVKQLAKQIKMDSGCKAELGLA